MPYGVHCKKKFTAAKIYHSGAAQVGNNQWIQKSGAALYWLQMSGANAYKK